MSKQNPIQRAISKANRRDWAILEFINYIRKPWFELMQEILIVGVFAYLHSNGPRNIIIDIIYLISVAIFSFGLFALLKTIFLYPLISHSLKLKINPLILLGLWVLLILFIVWFVTDYLIDLFILLGR